MKETQQEIKTEGQTSTTPPAVILPNWAADHDKKLKQSELQFAVALGEKHPSIVGAALEFRSGLLEADKLLGVASDRYRVLVRSVHDAKLNRRESSLLLRGLGMAANRISEILRVAELTGPTYAKYIGGGVGFKAIIAEDTAKRKAAGQKVKAGRKVAKPRIVIHDLSPVNAKLLRDAVAAMSRLLKGGTTTEWVHAFVCPWGKAYVALTASPKDSPEAKGSEGGDGEGEGEE